MTRDQIRKRKACERARKWRLANLERATANGKAWREANQERVKELKKRYHERNAEKIRARATRWYYENKARALANVLANSARKRGATIADLTASQWAEIKERYNLSCAYCGERVAVLTQDHVLAIRRGGQHTASNIVPACRSCNSKKSNKLVSEFLKG